MPLKSGPGKAKMSYNIKEMEAAGHKPSQAVAVAYKQASKNDGEFYGHLYGNQKGKPIYGGQEVC